MILSRTGYTGEIGMELYFKGGEDIAKKVWDALFEAGAEFGIEAIGADISSGGCFLNTTYILMADVICMVHLLCTGTLTYLPLNQDGKKLYLRMESIMC